ncbi:c-type cytochrome [Alkalilimnicola sp. S0819]|uniref:c-type cytochrome n=1 Tax=Alkalilimnicola sp. S0819 TaxID=2613922 RepID=UPI001261C21E|nr:cytochrome c [Alkalilimnicola sp. S0819]KAB7623216.1 cytochrome c [Alkalilimnicola sp. S0819]MPQ17064.1 c-type cytochrome [Alkalilimnicola sp. S0819]
MRAKSLMLGGLGLMLALSGTAYAQGDAEAGERKATACMGCHGVDGYRNAYPAYRVPRIGGQHGDYLVAALKQYQAGERAHSTMHAQAEELSDQDIQDIAAYFARQKQ